MKKKSISLGRCPLGLKQFLRIMKLSMLFLVIATLHLSASVYSQNEILSLKMENASLRNVLAQIEGQTELTFFFQNEQLDAVAPISIDATNQSVDEILARVFKDSSLDFRIVDKHVVIFPANKPQQAVQPQGKTVTGKVVDANGEPIPGASIVIKGTSTGTITDMEGVFKLSTVAPEATLIFSFVGMKTQEVELAGKDRFNIVLVEESLGLDEVVVTALGISRESKAIGYSVTEVGGDRLAETGQTNVVTALSGKVAGVNITGSSSGIDGTNRIVIRGETSLSNDNQPLIIVDGIPLQANQQLEASTIPSYGGISDWGSPIADINPEDIANLSVLKGASATALYGSRAANGVILITTKSGKKGQKGLGVTLTSSYTISNPLINELPWQKEYGQGYDGQYAYVDGNGNGTYDNNVRSWGPKFEGQMIPQWDPATGQAVTKPWEYHDNWKNFFDTGILSNTTIGITHGTETSSSRVSISYQKEDGIVPNTGLTRITANFNNNFEINDKLSVHLRGTLSNMDSKNRTGYGYNPVRDVYNMPANIDIRELKKYYKTPQGERNSFYENGLNPYWGLYENTNPSERKRMSIGVTVKYDINDWLYLQGEAVQDQTRVDYSQRTAAYKYNAGAYSQGSTFDQEYDFNARLGFNKDFTTWGLSGLFGTEVRNVQNRSESASTVGGLINKGVYNLDNSLKPVNSSHFMSEKEVQSVFGNVNFNYRKYLYLDLSERIDWSSTLPQNNWRFSYPSVSLSYVFSEMLNIDKSILSFGKIRASWAQVGSDTSPYFLNLYVNRWGDSWNGEPIQSLDATLPPTNLKPEISNSKEIGTMLSFLNNRINLDFAWYQTNTENQIVTIDTQWERGFRWARINVGDLETSGVEVALNTTPVQTKEFRWDLNFIYNRNRGKLNELYGELTHQRIGEWYGSETRAEVGERYGSVWGFPYMVDSEEMWEQLSPMQQDIPNKEDLYGTGKVLTQDGKPMHTVWRGGPYDMGLYFTPDWTGSISTTLTYKDFTLSMLFDGRFGGNVISTTYQHAYLYGLVDKTAGLNQKGNPKRDPVAEGGGILFDGTDVATGQPNTTYIDTQEQFYGWNTGSPDFIFDATNIKLRDLVFSYKIPSRITTKYGLGTASIAFIGHNLLLLKNNMPGIDSETMMGYSNNGQGLEVASIPTARNLGLKISLNF